MTEQDKYSQSDRQMERNTERPTGSGKADTDRQIRVSQRDRQMDRQSRARQRDRWTDTDTDKQTNRRRHSQADGEKYYSVAFATLTFMIPSLHHIFSTRVGISGFERLQREPDKAKERRRPHQTCWYCFRHRWKVSEQS